MVTSLSRAVQELNHHVDIIFPKYDCLNLSNVSFITVAFLHISHPINPLCIIYLFIFFMLLHHNLQVKRIWSLIYSLLVPLPESEGLYVIIDLWILPSFIYLKTCLIK